MHLQPTEFYKGLFSSTIISNHKFTGNREKNFNVFMKFDFLSKDNNNV
jgi:hypothetical protein